MASKTHHYSTNSIEHRKLMWSNQMLFSQSEYSQTSTTCEYCGDKGEIITHSYKMGINQVIYFWKEGFIYIKELGDECLVYFCDILHLSGGTFRNCNLFLFPRNWVGLVFSHATNFAISLTTDKVWRKYLCKTQMVILFWKQLLLIIPIVLTSEDRNQP